MSSRFTPIQRICAWASCSQSFTIYPTRGRDILRTFCSTSCRAKHAKSTQDTGTLAEHFWAKVAKGLPDECWMWQASKGSSGYGTMRVPAQRRLVGAHVISWFLATGRWPTDGMEIMHHCPTGHRKDCVNSAHLHEGTHLENMQDMYAKGGPRKTWIKVSDAQVKEMWDLYATGEWTYKQLAAKYGIGERTPHDIFKHRLKHQL